MIQKDEKDRAKCSGVSIRSFLSLAVNMYEMVSSPLQICLHYVNVLVWLQSSCPLEYYA